LATQELFASKRVGREVDALTGKARAHLVHRAELRNQVVPEVEYPFGGVDPGIGVAAFRSRWRAGEASFPGQRCPELRVLSQELVENRGTGSWESDDEDGAVDSLLANLGLVVDEVRDSKAILEKVEQVGAHEHTPQKREAGFAVEAAGEYLERLDEVVWTEVRECRRVARGLQELRRVQGNEAFRVLNQILAHLV
jgi:hypothetical protein